MFPRLLAGVLVGGLVGGTALLPASPAFGQSAAAPAFQAADVHVSGPTMSPGAGVRPGAIRNGVYEVGNATMLDLIRIAYRIEADKIFGGPNWLEVDRFDVSAKVPAAMTARSRPPVAPDAARGSFQAGGSSRHAAAERVGAVRGEARGLP